MFMKNSTSFAVTASPFDHFMFLSAMVAVVSLLLYVGSDANDRVGFSVVLSLLGKPNM